MKTKLLVALAALVIASLACGLFTPNAPASGATAEAPVAQNTPAPAAQDQGATSYSIDGNTVTVSANGVVVAKVEFLTSVDNMPTEWLKNREGVAYLYQSGINNKVDLRVTLMEGGAFAADGDQFQVGATTLGKVNDAADARVFADTPGVYSFTGWSFGLAVGPYRDANDKAGFVLADRRAADNDNRPEYWLPPDGSEPKEVGK